MLFIYSILVCALNAGWVMLNAVGLPGNWLLVLTTAGYAWWTAEEKVIHVGVLVALLAMAIVGEIVEFALGAAGAAKSGGTWRGAVGAIAGAIFGGILGTFFIPVPVVGSILGACGGAFCGAMLLELGGGKSRGEAVKVGSGAAVGRLLGTVTKLMIGFAMWVTAAVAVFWP